MLELEMLRRCVETRALLWQALTEVAQSESRLDTGELDRLYARARRQAARLEAMPAEAARMALTGVGSA